MPSNLEKYIQEGFLVKEVKSLGDSATVIVLVLEDHEIRVAAPLLAADSSFPSAWLVPKPQKDEIHESDASGVKTSTNLPEGYIGPVICTGGQYSYNGDYKITLAHSLI